MNPFIILYTLGNYLIFFAVAFLPSILWAIYYRELKMLIIFKILFWKVLLIGFLLSYFTRKKGKKGIFNKKEGLLIVALIWIISGFFGGLPFYLSGSIHSFTASVFESVSGFTTTGASVLSDIEALPYSLLFFRSFTHWLGGLGIVVLFIAVLPYLGVGGRILFRFEVPGPEAEVVRPRVRETAIVLLKIYIGMTIIETALLYFAGMNLFDSLCHTFGTLATGGFSTKNTSLSFYNNLNIEIIITVFMFLAGVNFSLYHYFFQGSKKIFFKDTEFKIYIAVILSSVILISVNMFIHYKMNLFQNLRETVFQVVSIQTTTGFTTADFDKWPAFSKMVLFFLMFIGGCAGSTGGGLKVIRWIIVFKYISTQIKNVFHPKAIFPVKVKKQSIHESVVKSVVGLFCLWFLVWGISSLFISWMGFDFLTSVSAVAATLNNIGPGFGGVGATLNYSQIPDIGKFILTICMLFGRLEIYSIIILLHPAFWKR